MSLHDRKQDQEALRTELERILAKAQRAVNCYKAYLGLGLAAQVLCDYAETGKNPYLTQPELVIRIARITGEDEQIILNEYIGPGLQAGELELNGLVCYPEYAYRLDADILGGVENETKI